MPSGKADGQWPIAPSPSAAAPATKAGIPPASPISWNIPCFAAPLAKARRSSPVTWTAWAGNSLHATVLKEDLGKAARLLFELATEATFPDKEIETERGVVLDEIISYKDNPAEDVYDRFEELLFAGFPLQTPILGTTASVKKITPEMLRSFVREQFVPEKMVFTVVADIGEAKLEKQVLKIIDHVFSQSH